LEPYDNVIVYYAGHGYLDSKRNRGFWVPVDAKGFESTSFVRNSTIRDELTAIAEKAKHTLLISDSCFSGALLRGGNRGFSRIDEPGRYYTKVLNKKSVQVIAAGGLEFVDDNYKNSGHSPFTYFLLNELKHNTSDLMSLSELATRVTKIVANNVDQTPEVGVLQGSVDELGKFIFARRDISGLYFPIVKTEKNRLAPLNYIQQQNASPEFVELDNYFPIPSL